MSYYLCSKVAASWNNRPEARLHPLRVVRIGCATNFLTIGPSKRKVMIFGPLLHALPKLTVGDKQLEFVDEFQYLSLLESHQQTVERSQHGLFNFCNEVYDWYYFRKSIQLHKSRTEPHLTVACKVIIYVDDSCLALLEGVQMLFLRRLLGLHSRSMRAVLFTKRGIVPIRYHRVILAL